MKTGWNLSPYPRRWERWILEKRWNWPTIGNEGTVGERNQGQGTFCFLKNTPGHPRQPKQGAKWVILCLQPDICTGWESSLTRVREIGCWPASSPWGDRVRRSLRSVCWVFEPPKLQSDFLKERRAGGFSRGQPYQDAESPQLALVLCTACIIQQYY